MKHNDNLASFERFTSNSTSDSNLDENSNPVSIDSTTGEWRNQQSTRIRAALGSGIREHWREIVGRRCLSSESWAHHEH